MLSALLAAGMERPWSHQRAAIDLATAGEHVVIATGTASGKSLGYLAPVLSAASEGAAAPGLRGATAIYLAPTKALAADQLARIEAMAVPGVRAATYDGDTPPDERRWIRDHANVVLTNPDLLHHSLLPGHERWSRFLRSLRVRRRRRVPRLPRGVRLARRGGAAPAATGRRPLRRDADVRARVGHRVRPRHARGTPDRDAGHGRHRRRLAARGDDLRPVGARRRSTATVASATTEAAEILAELVLDGVQAVAFARSRAGAEALATNARRRVEHDDPARAEGVAAYRGGYLPQDRREIERGLRDGTVRGLAATNALELGIDVSGLDAVVHGRLAGSSAPACGSRPGGPGARARSRWRCSWRPTTRSTPTSCATPRRSSAQPVEATVMDPHNPHVLAPHLAAAAAELPLGESDLPMFGPDARRLLDALVASGILRRRPSGWFWAREDRPAEHISLRGASDVVAVVEARTGRVLGTVDEASSHAQVHTGAVHVHQGDTWVVTELDLEARAAHVVRGDPGWSTHAQSVSRFDILGRERTERRARVSVSFGTVRVTSQVTGFLRRLPSGEVLGTHPLDLPERSLTTKAVWWTVPEDVLAAAGVEATVVPGALHAAEHAAIGMLPLVATSDRWDVGGVSTALHPDTGEPTIMVFDGYPGGAGFAERAFGAFEAWVRATRDAVLGCPCATGCPACVQSPKCGNGNEPLDKAGAVTVLELALAPAQT